MSRVDLNELAEKLRLAPDTASWRLILSRAIDGTLNDAIDRIGGIENLVDTFIANSIDPTASRLYFADALETLVSDWQPSHPQSAQSLETIIRLIASYTPHSGFTKLLGHLRDGHLFLTETEDPDFNDFIEQFALNALKSYFPVPPYQPIAVRAFESYQSLLIEHLQLTKKRAYACIRLIELDYLKVDGPYFGSFLKTHSEELIPTIVEWLLNSNRPDKRSLLESLYLHGQESKSALFALQQSLEKFGAQVELRDYRVEIKLPNVATIEIPFDSETYARLASLEWQDMADRGVELLTGFDIEDIG
jgi:hypothetical protein